MRHAPLLAGLVAAGLAALVAPAPRPVLAVPPGAAAANEEGARLFLSGAVQESVPRFEEALAADPGFDQARRNLAAALATLAQRELGTGNLDDARARLERAVALAPDEAPYHFLLGTLHFRRGDLYEARQHVDRALELAPGLGEARELSGDLYYQEGWLDRARSEWEAALPASGRRAPAIGSKIARVSREAAAEGGFGRDVSRHFTIQYDGPVSPQVARTALRLLEDAYDRLWREFGRAPQHDIPVILYARETFLHVTRSPAWVAGSYDGKIRIPVGGLSTDEDAERLRPVLAHELTHAFIRANVPGSLPLWFEEGLAEHFAGSDAGEAARLLRASGGGFPSLDAVSAALRGGPRVAEAYAAARIAIAQMLRLDGFWLPRRILELVAAGRPFAAALRDASGLEPAEFEQLWLEAQR
jgi:tetratricopeptide (TPR) repeat protein